jgi:hypothetical protein
VRRTAWLAPECRGHEEIVSAHPDREHVSVLALFLALVLAAVVVLVISAPLRAARRSPETASAGRQKPGCASVGEHASADRDELETAREAKYREIRDAELDYRTGKLSREDYETIDGALRAEAVEILNRLAALEQGSSPASPKESEPAT